MNIIQDNIHELSHLIFERSHIVDYIVECSFQIIGALVIGYFLNYIFDYVNKYIKNKYLVIVLHLLTIMCILYFISVLFKTYSYEWQLTTAGIFFPAILFSTQYILFDNIHEVYDIINPNIPNDKNTKNKK